MKKIAIPLIVSFIVISSISLAHETMKSVEEVMKEIMDKQSVVSASRIDCDMVSPHDFEEMGEAVMERMIGNSELHEQMDLMMGGEGSESLRVMHENMGRNWLGCGLLRVSSMMPMMPGMMRMMGNYYPGYYTTQSNILLLGAIGWVAFLIVLAMLLKGYKMKGKRPK